MPLIINSYVFAGAGGTPAVNPVIQVAQYTAGSGGTEATIAIEVEYNGTDTLTLYGATGENPVTVTKPQLSAGSGGTGTLEFFDFAVTPGGDLDIVSGLTASSETADRIAFYIVEDTNGGTTEIEIVTVSGLDFTAPALSSASPADNATGVAIETTIALTFAETVLGVSGLDFYLYEDIDTTPALVETFVLSSASAGAGDAGGTIGVSGAVVTITPGASLATSTQHSIRWEAGAVEDVSGTPIAANTADTIYNFTTTSASAWAFTEGDTQVSITSAPAAPATPTVDSAGDTQATLS